MSSECVPWNQCTCPVSPKRFEGDKKATTTYYTQGESLGIGSCGGCLYPRCTNCGGSDEKHNYQNMFVALQNIKSSVPWTMAATAQSMMGPWCQPNAKGMGCSGRVSPTGNTADAPCGTCWELTNDKQTKINVVITDSCPYEDNVEWCPKNAGEVNQHQAYNHFDVWNGNILPNWGDNPKVTFRNISCPEEVKAIIQEGCCGTYWEDQGCPEICGASYHCPSGITQRREYYTLREYP